MDKTNPIWSGMNLTQVQPRVDCIYDPLLSGFHAFHTDYGYATGVIHSGLGSQVNLKIGVRLIYDNLISGYRPIRTTDF